MNKNIVYRPIEYKGMLGVIFSDKNSAMWYGVLNGVPYGTYTEHQAKTLDEIIELADVMEQFAHKQIDKLTNV